MNESFALEFADAAAVIFVSNNSNPYGIQASACAAENIVLATIPQDQEQGCLWSAICEEPEMEVLLREQGIPETHHVRVKVALGHSVNQVGAKVENKGITVIEINEADKWGKNKKVKRVMD